MRDGQVEVVQELEVGWALASRDNGLGERECTGTTLGPVVADDGSVGAALEREVANKLKFGRSVSAARCTLATY